MTRGTALTHCDPNRNVPSTAKIWHEDNCYDISNLIAASNETREARRYVEPFLDGCNHRIDVSGAQCLLEGDQNWEEKYKYLKQIPHQYSYHVIEPSRRNE